MNVDDNALRHADIMVSMMLVKKILQKCLKKSNLC
jgi:hypothetical protein